MERDADAVTIGDDPYVIIRPEGRWHVPGILELPASCTPIRPLGEDDASRTKSPPTAESRTA
jgi:hypothetical protein